MTTIELTKRNTVALAINGFLLTFLLDVVFWGIHLNPLSYVWYVPLVPLAFGVLGVAARFLLSVPSNGKKQGGEE